MDITEFAHKTGINASEIEPYWEEANALAQSTLSRMPDIGFMSRERRLNAFLFAVNIFRGFSMKMDKITKQES